MYVEKLTDCNKHLKGVAESIERIQGRCSKLRLFHRATTLLALTNSNIEICFHVRYFLFPFLISLFHVIPLLQRTAFNGLPRQLHGLSRPSYPSQQKEAFTCILIWVSLLVRSNLRNDHPHQRNVFFAV